MDRSSLRTSVVIEVANQEEPDDQKTYQIDFDDLDVPKDYVLDQVFCGENITVYALLEVPEDSNVSSSNDQIVDVTSQKAHGDYRLFQGASKNIMNHRKLNGVKHSLISQEESSMTILPNKDNGNRSFYCLKHLNGDYDMLTPERENSELKVLYSKSTVPRDSKSTKFKAVSKGVNTDIVQSPKIIQEVEKAVRQNTAFSGGLKSISSSRSSYEVIEMEMRQSFSSLSSYGDTKKPSKKSVPNFFLVPLLMMDDGVWSHFQSEDKVQKLLVEKERKVEPEKVSIGTNTDMLKAEPQSDGKKHDENVTVVSPLERFNSESDIQQKQLNSNPDKKYNNKNTILSEIKKLQTKLNSLIASIESENFDLDARETDSKVPPEKVDLFETTPPLVVELSKPFKSTRRKYDDLPILSSLTYPQCKTGKKKRSETPCEEHSEDIPVVPAMSNSTEVISGENSSKSQITRTNSVSNCQAVKPKEELKPPSSSTSIVWSELENRRGTGLSKSTTNGLNSLDSKFSFVNGLKKSWSFDLRDVKLEVTCLKKIKNNSFKLETKANIRIPQKGETILKCEMGDEVCNKPKSSKLDFLILSKPMDSVNDLKLEQKNLDSKKSLKEEEGDAKLVYSKQNLFAEMIARQTENIEVHFCNTISLAQKDNIIPVEKSILPIPVKSKGACSVVEVEPKAGSDTDKPTTPGKTSKRTNPPNINAKKEQKTVKKFNYQPTKIKPPERTAKTEVKEMSPQEVKQRSVTGSRKFTLKGTAESKLHVDRLMKLENSKTGTERLGMRTSRLACHKRDSPDPPEESKEKTSKTNINRKENSASGLERIGEDNSEENPKEVVPQQSGVLVELLSEKPSEKLCPDENPKCTDLIKTLDGDMIFERNAKSLEEVSDDSLSPGKPVLKSVWALTKVLLFEDGSRKIEILEASLTPPGYSLPKPLTE